MLRKKVIRVSSTEYMEETLPKTYEAELVEDMLFLMSSSSARIYGKRSA
ncbi:MAG: hypothetical protein ACKOPK_02545 [Dolichospermum sp.]